MTAACEVKLDLDYILAEMRRHPELATERPDPTLDRLIWIDEETSVTARQAVAILSRGELSDAGLAFAIRHGLEWAILAAKVRQLARLELFH